MKPEQLSWIPLTLFGIFVVFWSAWDMKLGLWTGIAPSGLIIAAMLAFPKHPSWRK